MNANLTKADIEKLVKQGAMKYPDPNEQTTIPRPPTGKLLTFDESVARAETIRRANAIVFKDWCEQNSNMVRAINNRMLDAIEEKLRAIVSEYEGKNELVLARAVERAIAELRLHRK